MNVSRQTASIVLAIAIFASLSIAGAVSSEGFLEADACTHYLYARFALEQPHYLVNVWGRPLCTALYALPAVLGGRLAVRATSLVLAIACGLIAYRIARNQRYRWPALALIFTLAQPLVFLHSFSELTELPFALLIGLAFWAYQKRQWWAVAILIGISPLSRPEGLGFVALAAVALIVHRRWWWLLVLPIPLVLWNHAGWVVCGSGGSWWRWLIDNWPYAAVSLYERGSVFHYLMLLPAVTSPLVFPATCAGIWRSLRWRHEDRCQVLIGLIPLLILVGHSVLYATGKLASSGEIRYMLVVAPFWALLAAKGWEWIFERLDWKHPIVPAGLAALMPIIANVTYKVVPLRFDDDWRRARRFALWYEHAGISDRYPRLATAHVGVYYFMDMAPTDRSRSLQWRKDTLARPTPGTIVVWHPMYAIYNSDAACRVPLEDLLVAGWIDATDRTPTMGPQWRILLSPKDIRGAEAHDD